MEWIFIFQKLESNANFKTEMAVLKLTPHAIIRCEIFNRLTSRRREKISKNCLKLAAGPSVTTENSTLMGRPYH